MSLKDEIKPFIDDNGQVLPELNTPGGPQTGNGLLYTSLYYLLLHRARECTRADVRDFTQIVLDSEVPGHPGLFHRAPEKIEEQIAWDDYIGVISAANQLGAAFLRGSIREQSRRRYMLAFRFCYPNTSPNRLQPFKAWFGRNPWYTAFAKMSLGMWHTGLADAFLSLRLLSTAYRPNSNGIILDWLMLAPTRAQSIMVEDAGKIWESSVKKSKYGGLAGALAEHFTREGFDGWQHPLSAHAKRLGL